MRYSVLCSVYYKEDPSYLEQCIRSILSQTVLTDDFVIVKDGKLTEELDKVIDCAQLNNKNIRVIALHENKGLGAALNVGLRECKNELVARMDTDDIADFNRCKLQLEEFKLDNSLDIVGTYMYEFDTDPNKIEAVKEVPLSHNEIIRFAKRRNPFNHPTVMYKKSSVLNCGGYIESRRGEDLDLFIRMLHSGKKGKNINIPLIRYRSNINMLKRRKSLIETKSYISVIYRSWKLGFSGINDLAYAIASQLILMAIPLKLARYIYSNFLRRRMSNN